MPITTPRVIKRVSLPDQVADTLSEMILSGQLQPGEHILQDKLASELGISRTPLRHALLRLQGEGLVKLSGGRGVEVTRFNAAELLELYDLRQALDGMAAKLAAINITAEQAAEVKSVLDSMEALVEHPVSHEWLPDNLRFHLLLIEVANNRYLRQLSSYVQRSSQLFHRMLMLTPQHTVTTHHQHRQIYEAVVAGDALAAEAAAKAHIESNIELIRQVMERIPH